MDRKKEGKWLEMSGSSPKCGDELFCEKAIFFFSKTYSQKTPLFSGFARKIEI